MTAFYEHFNTPFKDHCGDSGYALSREHYTKEEAIKIFVDAYEEDEEPRSYEEVEKEITEGRAWYGFGTDGYDHHHAWWWAGGEPQKKNQKPVWLARW